MTAVTGALRAAMEVYDLPLTDLTVLSNQNDPFRVDTPAGHRDGAWLAMNLAEIGVTGPKHMRGLHYILVSGNITKPNGEPYINCEKDWLFLGRAAKCARWLRYVPFDSIVDQRNDAPEVRRQKLPDPSAEIAVDFDIVVPDADDLTPRPYLAGFHGTQPYRIVLVGEKSSLREVLAPVADRYHADLYLPTGEISDTQIYGMARDMAEDGRPAVVLYFSDCDPSGWQMPISVSRKLQAFRALEFPDVDVQLHRVALTPDQVRSHGLPSTPLSEGELRKARWIALMGVEQTEIDALAALQPEVLQDMAETAIKPFWDSTLDRRVRDARQEWLQAAQAAVDAQDDALDRDAVLSAVEAKADELREVLDSVRVDADDFDLPDVPEVPEAVARGFDPDMVPLLDTRWSFPTQCQVLKDSKAYED